MAETKEPHSRKPHNDLKPTFIRSIFDYDVKTGVLRWKKSAGHWGKRGGNSRPGRIAGWINTNGYLYVRIQKKSYLVHRIAHVIVTGEWPTSTVDHIRSNTTDNRWKFLRPATHRQNIANQQKSKRNTSGFKGVSRIGNRWRAQITADKIHYHIGVFSTKKEAHTAYCNAAKQLHKDFARFE